MITILRDADILIYRLALMFQEEFEFDPEEPPAISYDLDGAIERLNKIAEREREHCKADEYIMCLTDTTNWRKSVYPEYKSNRKDVEKPQLVYPLREYVEENYRTYLKPTLEADDCMGILSTHRTAIKGKKIIISEDKDLKTIPGWLWNPDCDSRPRRVTRREADRFHLIQSLAGDVTDGYPGCPMIGMLKAEELVANPVVLVPYEHEFTRGQRKGEVEVRYRKEPTDCIWKAIVSHYAAKGLDEEYALAQAQVARICRNTEYNFKKKEVKPWQPKLPLKL